MQHINLAHLLLLGSLLLGISVRAIPPKESVLYFTVKNNLNIARTSETVSLPVAKVAALVKTFGATRLQIKEVTTNKLLVTQAIDNNADGTVDAILFQIDIPAQAEKKFSISGLKSGTMVASSSKLTTYARFVPERTDDFAWENDRVAFRTYGPVAQQLVEQNKPGGTLTSGIDAWLKRVSYPIIDKWYQKNSTESGYYHIDHGEGYDPYHVGASRGIGGLGIMAGDSLYVSKNFVQYKILANGPIRTLFELTYAPWPAQNNLITEKKIISLDLGSNLTRLEVELKSNEPVSNSTIGITLHEKKGEVQVNQTAGWFRYWEPMDEAFLGTAVVVDPTFVQSYQEHRVNTKDQSHLYVVTKPITGKLVYYAGFCWSKSKQFTTPAQWDAYLATFAQNLASPLEVRFKNSE